MKKLFVLVAFLLAISIFPQKTQAFEKTHEASANFKLSQDKGTESSDKRVMALQNVFKRYNSELVPYAQSYVKYADIYHIDWRLLPAIAGNESYFATYYIPGTYNAYGWGGGYIYFTSWEDGIKNISHDLKYNYYDHGATNVWSIGPIYAEDPAWSSKVYNYMSQIDAEYIQLTSLGLGPTL